MKSHIGFWISKRGLKQKFIAQQMGVSQEMVSKWINNKAYPRADKLFKLAVLLNVKVDDLYESVDHSANIESEE